MEEDNFGLNFSSLSALSDESVPLPATDQSTSSKYLSYEAILNLLFQAKARFKIFVE